MQWRIWSLYPWKNSLSLRQNKEHPEAVSTRANPLGEQQHFQNKCTGNTCISWTWRGASADELFYNYLATKSSFNDRFNFFQHLQIIYTDSFPLDYRTMWFLSVSWIDLAQRVVGVGHHLFSMRVWTFWTRSRAIVRTWETSCRSAISEERVWKSFCLIRG